MNRIFLIIFLLISNLVLSQSQILNDIDLNGPQGFVKVDNLTWMKGNDIIAVFSVKQTKEEFSKEYWENTCKNGTRATEFHSLYDYELNGINYSICYQIGQNDMLIGQVAVFKDQYTYIINVGVSMLDRRESNRFSISKKEAEFNIGYMIARILIF